MNEWTIGALALLLAFGAGAGITHKLDRAAADRLALAQQQAQAAQSASADVATAGADQRAAEHAAINAGINQSIVAEVAHRVPKTVSCPGYVDAVRVLNNAAASGVPLSAPAGRPDARAAAAGGSPGRDPAADAARAERVEAVNVANLGRCRAELDRLRDLQSWIRGVSE